MKDIATDTYSRIMRQQKQVRYAVWRGRIETVVCCGLLFLLIEAMRYWT